jgi:hypothetical protein
MNLSNDWKDLIAREVLIVTALLVGIFAAQPLLLHLGVGYGILYPALFLYWLRLCYGAVSYARTRPHLHHDFHRVLTVLGTLIVLLGSFWLFSNVAVPKALGAVVLIGGVLTIAWAQQLFAKPPREPASAPVAETPRTESLRN